MPADSPYELTGYRMGQEIGAEVVAGAFTSAAVKAHAEGKVKEYNKTLEHPTKDIEMVLVRYSDGTTAVVPAPGPAIGSPKR